MSQLFSEKIHRVGRITVFLCLIAFLLVPIGLANIYQIEIDYPLVFQNALPILFMFTIVGISENLSYAPLIGSGALYIACVTGNLSSMKVPASINAMKLLDVEAGTEKAEVLSILAVSTCTFVTITIMFLGMLFFAPIIEPIYQSKLLNPAFTNLMPALFGALIVPALFSNLKVYLPIFLLPAGIYLFTDVAFFQTNQGFILLFCTGFAILYSLFFLRKTTQPLEEETTS